MYAFYLELILAAHFCYQGLSKLESAMMALEFLDEGGIYCLSPTLHHLDCNSKAAGAELSVLVSAWSYYFSLNPHTYHEAF